jgi:CubicO group peptidase (beta-lactamase class C family)
MSKVKASEVDGLKAQIDQLTSDPDGAPGIVFAAVNKSGDIIFEHASGKTGCGQDAPMTMETVFWIASCTKMIAGIACMQLVEQGKLKLDDVESIEKLCPELKEVKVLDDNGNLVDKEQGITLRMLLSHTAGFGYSFFNAKLLKHYGAAGLDEFSGNFHDFLSQPLVNQPGTRWEYGINIDWAGICVERVSGLSLNDYFQKNIFGPMGVKHINMFPSSEMVSKLAYMNSRAPDGKLSPNPQGHINRKSLHAKTKAEIETTFNSAGAGCFARPVEYCQIIATLLNDGKHPGTGAQILKKETVDEMFSNQIPDMPDFGRQVRSHLTLLFLLPHQHPPNIPPHKRN